MGGGGCRGGVCGIRSMFGLEVKALTLDSQEDNGKERERGEREVYGCVCTLTGGRHILMGGLACVFVCVCLFV